MAISFPSGINSTVEVSMFELKSLKTALKRLEEGLASYHKNPHDLMRDGCIQRFKYSYELSCKMIQGYLKEESSNASSIDILSFKDLIKMAIRKGIISDNFEKWIQYKSYRNKTSHNYNQSLAEEIFTIIPDFLEEARFLLTQLKQRTEKN